ncbi:hypothetical protein [uncultured Treponema sp.]|uniref:hypothetical protein n=1 Tax=uncultured Treponema sp. TaxID=162155 RepID=UPI002591E9B6|nr:hypothetical protein [uncultured Treponema sp.]
MHLRTPALTRNIRKGPGTDYGKTGKYTGIGTFKIVEEADGKGVSSWGLLSCRAYCDNAVTGRCKKTENSANLPMPY